MHDTVHNISRTIYPAYASSPNFEGMYSTGSYQHAACLYTNSLSHKTSPIRPLEGALSPSNLQEAPRQFNLENRLPIKQEPNEKDNEGKCITHAHKLLGTEMKDEKIVIFKTHFQFAIRFAVMTPLLKKLYTLVEGH